MKTFNPPVRYGVRGFSLVEMMLCLVLLGILLVVGLSHLRGMIPSARVNRAAREVASLLEWTRWQAVEHGAVYQVVFDSENERVSVFREISGSGGAAPQQALRTLDLHSKHPGVVFGTATSTFRTSGCSYVDDSGIHFRDSIARFLPTGTSDRCGSLYLIPEKDLPAGQEHLAALSVLLSTGRVQLWRYDPLDVSSCSHAGAWIPIL